MEICKDEVFVFWQKYDEKCYSTARDTRHGRHFGDKSDRVTDIFYCTLTLKEENKI